MLSSFGTSIIGGESYCTTADFNNEEFNAGCRAAIRTGDSIGCRAFGIGSASFRDRGCYRAESDVNIAELPALRLQPYQKLVDKNDLMKSARSVLGPAAGLSQLGPGSNRGGKCRAQKEICCRQQRVRAESFRRRTMQWKNTGLPCAKHPISGIAQARKNISAIIQFFVKSRGNDRHIGVLRFHCANAFGSRK